MKLHTSKKVIVIVLGSLTAMGISSLTIRNAKVRAQGWAVGAPLSNSLRIAGQTARGEMSQTVNTGHPSLVAARGSLGAVPVSPVANLTVTNTNDSGPGSLRQAIQDSGTNGNQVQGNLIGTNINGTGVLSNTGSGVTVSGGASGNTIGGTATGTANVIAFKGAAGVAVLSNNSLRNAVLGNSIVSNTGLGIDLASGTAPDGVTANDAGDPGSGPNNLQNFPVLSRVTTAGVITGSLDSLSSNTAYPVRIEFFANTACDGSGNGEGEVFLGFTTLTGPGNFTASITPIPGKPFMTATATDANGNTSEFSRCCVAMIINPATISAGTAGNSYSQTFTQTGGARTITFTETGTLPPGMTFSSGGVLSGVPMQVGNFPLTITATDSNGCTGSRDYTFTINCPNLTVNPATLPAGTAGAAYPSTSFTAVSGIAPYSFTLSGTLPIAPAVVITRWRLTAPPPVSQLLARPSQRLVGLAVST